jgi:hypothetical protein
MMKEETTTIVKPPARVIIDTKPTLIPRIPSIARDTPVVAKPKIIGNFRPLESRRDPATKAPRKVGIAQIK